MNTRIIEDYQEIFLFSFYLLICIIIFNLINIPIFGNLNFITINNDK